jgi:hypothetical protein
MAMKYTDKTLAIKIAFDALYETCEKVEASELLPALAAGRNVSVKIREMEARMGLRKMQVLGGVAWLEQGEVLYQLRNSKREVVALIPFALAAGLAALDNL